MKVMEERRDSKVSMEDEKAQQDRPRSPKEVFAAIEHQLAQHKTLITELRQSLSELSVNDKPQLQERLQDQETFKAELETLQDDGLQLLDRCAMLEMTLKVERRRLFFARAAMLLCVVSVVVGAIAVGMGVTGPGDCIVVPVRMVNWVE
jgi:hypothetical protein